MSKNKEYNASSIKVYKGLDGVRKTPTVYVNETNDNGIFKIFGEAVDNSIDEAAEGHGNVVQVVYDNGYIWVKDEGRGLPVDLHQKEGITGLELILTQLNAGGKSEVEGTAGYKKATFGIFGMGISVTNALSSELQAWSYRNNTWNTQTFEKGKPTSKLTTAKCPSIPYITKINKKAGTVIRFKPDSSIFDPLSKIDLSRVKDYLDKASYLNKGLKLTYASKKGEKTYFQPRGLVAYLENIISKNQLEIWGKSLTVETDSVSLCMQWTKTDEDYMHSLVNSGTVKEGGTHIAGFNKAILEALSAYTTKKSNYKIEDVRAGLVTIINFSVKNPKFSSQIKDRLITPEATAMVYDVLKQPLADFFNKNKGFAKELVKRATELAKISNQAVMDKKAKAALKSKKSLGIAKKLSPCFTKDREKALLYCVEGDSASGSMMQARDADIHAIYRLRGKVLNVYGASGTNSKIFANEEIKGLLVALGYDPEKPKEFKLNYGKIVIASDADVDGCLPSNTKILTLDGSNPKIGNVYKNWTTEHKGKLWVWGRKDSDEPMTPVLATNVIKVKRSHFIRITLDDGTIFESTRHHSWIINDNGVERRVKAKELRIGDSLPAVFLENRYADGTTLKEGEREYKALLRPWSARALSRYDPKSYPNTPVDNEGYPLTVDKMLHQISFKHFNPKLYRKWKKLNKGVNGGIYHIHHKNNDGFDNLAENLEMLKMETHRALHGLEWVEQYNGSKQHLEDLKNFRDTDLGKDKIKAFKEMTLIHNKSDVNKESTAALNRNKEIRKLQVLGRYARKYLLIEQLGLRVNKINWNKTKSVDSIANCSWDNLEASIQEIESFIKPHHKPCRQKLNKSKYPTQCRSKFLSVCRSTFEKHKKLTEPLYEKMRKDSNQPRNPKWQTGIKLFDSVDDVLEIINNKELTNHKIVKVEHLRSKKDREYYCLEVPETSNFYLEDANSNGVITGNSHISVLMLSALHKLVPHLFEQGKVYILKSSLFTAEYKGVRLFGDSREDILEKTKGIMPKSGITRIKGLGEAEPAWMKTMAFDTKTAKFIKVESIGREDSKKYITLVGEGVEGVTARKKLVGI